jgi:hypothetical protein
VGLNPEPFWNPRVQDRGSIPLSHHPWSGPFLILHCQPSQAISRKGPIWSPSLIHSSVFLTDKPHQKARREVHVGYSSPAPLPPIILPLIIRLNSPPLAIA